MITDSPDEIMCVCSGTTRGELEAMFNQGLSLDDISRKTGALSGCSGCEWDISEFVRKLAEQNS